MPRDTVIDQFSADLAILLVARADQMAAQAAELDATDMPFSHGYLTGAADAYLTLARSLTDDSGLSARTAPIPAAGADDDGPEPYDLSAADLFDDWEPQIGPTE